MESALHRPAAPGAAYRWIVRFCRFVLATFFRDVEVVGLHHLPRDRGAVLVAWHPNGLVDPGLILTASPRQVIFGARHGLFRVPLLGQAMRAVGTVPIRRAMDGDLDPEARRRANDAALDSLAEQVARGCFSCLFPEGTSHDAPHLLDLKTGAARFWYRARQLQEPGAPTPAIVPVGLHYKRKRGFRSRVLVEFHKPLDIPAELLPLPPEDAAEELKGQARRLTDEIERALREVVHATEDWELHHLMHRVRKLVRAERGARAGSRSAAPDMQERTLGLARVWLGYERRLQTHPEEVEALLARVREYDRDLRALGMDDHELDRPPGFLSWRLVLMLAWQLLLVYVLLPPVLVLGFVVNLPPYLALGAGTRAVAKMKKDEATVKLLAGVLLFPACWAVVAWAAAAGNAALQAAVPALPHQPALAAATAFVLCFFGGLTALRYSELAAETSRAVRVRLTRARRKIAVARLKVERAELHDAIVALSEGLALPGAVSRDGRILRSALDITAEDLE